MQKGTRDQEIEQKKTSIGVVDKLKLVETIREAAATRFMAMRLDHASMRRGQNRQSRCKVPYFTQLLVFSRSDR